MQEFIIIYRIVKEYYYTQGGEDCFYYSIKAGYYAFKIR